MNKFKIQDKFEDIYAKFGIESNLIILLNVRDKKYRNAGGFDFETFSEDLITEVILEDHLKYSMTFIYIIEFEMMGVYMGEQTTQYYQYS